MRRTPTAVPDAQLHDFLAHIKALAERLTPRRRPQDRGEPECSRQELLVLAALGERGPATMTEIARILKVRMSTATHTVDKLVEKDLVVRKRSNPDRRVVEVEFSRRGLRINRYVEEARNAQGRALLGALPVAERSKLIKLLSRLRATK